MGKTELVEFIAAKAGLSKADALRAVDAFVEGVVEGLKKEGKVTWVGFGTFATSKRAATTAINPRTRETVKVPARNVAKFKAGKTLQDIVNS